MKARRVDKSCDFSRVMGLKTNPISSAQEQELILSEWNIRNIRNYENATQLLQNHISSVPCECKQFLNR